MDEKRVLFKIKFPMIEQPESSKRQWSPKVREMLEAKDFYYIGRERKEFLCGCQMEDSPDSSLLGIAEFGMSGPCGFAMHMMGLGQCPDCKAVYWSVWGMRTELWEDETIRLMAKKEAGDAESAEIIQ